MKKQHGLSLIEVTIAMAILALAVTAVMRLQKIMQEGSNQVVQMSSLTRTLNTIRETILEEDPYLPPQEVLTPDQIQNITTMDALLVDPEKAGMKCFDSAGNLMTCANLNQVFFVARYIKYRQPDMSFFNEVANRTSEVTRIPLSHYRIKIEYGAPPAVRKSVSFSQLVTPIIHY